MGYPFLKPPKALRKNIGPLIEALMGSNLGSGAPSPSCNQRKKICRVFALRLSDLKVQCPKERGETPGVLDRCSIELALSPHALPPSS